MKNNINWNFDNTYSKLPEPFREKINPVKVKNPKLILLNESLAKDLNLDFSEISQSELSAIFTGNELPKNSNSIAQAYACLLYTSPSPRDRQKSRMPSSA